MAQPSGGTRLDQIRDLLAHLGVESLEQASNVISERTDPDACIVEEDFGYVLRMGTLGCVIDFPTTLEDFWDLVDELEDEAVEGLESDLEEDA